MICLLYFFVVQCFFYTRCNAVCAIEPDDKGHVDIPNTWNEVQDNAFYPCESLVSITVPDNVASIGDSAFRGCSNLQSVTFGSKLKAIGESAFKECVNLESVIIPDDLEEIDYETFRGCSKLSSVQLGKKLKLIKNDAFRGCLSLQSIDFPDGIKVISHRSFSHSGLRSVTIPSSIQDIGQGAFALSRSLESATIGASPIVIINVQAFAFNFKLKNVAIDAINIICTGDPFIESTKVHLRINRSTAEVNGLPRQWGVGCTGNGEQSTRRCGCAKGYENLMPKSSPYFSCSACELGFNNKVEASLGLCDMCVPGRYAPQKASEACELCEEGKFGTDYIATSNLTCHPCPLGKYASSPGSSKCIPCPAGSFCPSNGTSEYTECVPGTYNSFPNQVQCQTCPSGTYGPFTGAAVCVNCPSGRYLSGVGAINESFCVDCPAGRFGDKEGLHECSKCPTGQVQPNEGQTSCSDCSLVSKIKTNNPEHTACIDDQALLSTSVVEVMFNKGVALSLAFTIAVIFHGLAVAMRYMKEKYSAEEMEGALADLNILQVALKSALPGFSFGSEMVLIGGMMTEDQGFGGTMLAFRMLHPLTMIVLTCILFIANDANLPARLRKMVRMSRLNEKFVRKNVAPVGLLILASGCDVTMLQLMPWEQSRFYEESMGYPCFDLMIVCMVVKTLQSLVSVVCQIGYLWKNSDLSDPTMSIQAKILFSLSITLSMVTLVMGVMMLLLKYGLLKKVADIEEEDEVSKAKEEDAAPVGELTPEIGDLYASIDEEGAVDSIHRVENPIHSAAFAELREENFRLREELRRYRSSSVEDEETGGSSLVPQQQALTTPSLEGDGDNSRLVYFGTVSVNTHQLERMNRPAPPRESPSETNFRTDTSNAVEKENADEDL